MRLIISTAHPIVLLLQEQLSNSKAVLPELPSYVSREPTDRPLLLGVPREREGHAFVREVSAEYAAGI